MKKIYIVDIWRRIKGSIVTYSSIILIVCLGISTYLGIGFAKLSMEETGNNYFTEQKLHHFEVNYNYGITEDDIDTLSNLSKVGAVEGIYRTTGFMQINKVKRLVTVQSITDNIDVAKVVEGRLPETQNEIAIEKVMADDDGITVGSTVVIHCEDADGNNSLVTTEFEVVGVVEHPAYSCNYVYGRRGVSEKGNGNCLNYFLVNKTAFSEEVYDNGYQSAIVWSEGLSKYNSFSEEYKQESNAIKQEIERIADTRSSIRYVEVKSEHNQQVEDAEAEVEAAKKRLEKAESEIEDGNKQLEDAEETLSSYKELYPNADYSEQEQEIEDAKKDLAEHNKSYADSQQVIEENNEKIQQAKSDIENMVEINWSIYDRNGNVSYALFEDNAEGLGNLSFSFAFVYIVVAMMVCYSSIGRMINRQKNLIGTQKALGFRPVEIYTQYMSYTWNATFWGCVNGVGWAVFFVEKLSLSTYKQMYYFEDYVSICDVKLALVVIGVAYVLTFFATIIACKKQIDKPAVILLKDEVIKEGKEFFFEKNGLWKKLSLFKRTIIKNLFNEKKHMITTIIGIAGCTALMIIGFTLNFAMCDVKINQFEKIQKFDSSLIVEPEKIDEFSKLLDGYSGIEKIAFMDQMTGIQLNGKDNIIADMLCADTEELNEFFLLEDDKTGKVVKNSKEGVYISSNTANYYQVEPGDKIEILKKNGEKVSVPVAGTVKNYVCHFIVVNPEYYEEVMGKTLEKNLFFLKLNGITKDELKQELASKDGFVTMAGKEMGVSIFDNIANSLKSVVQIMICLSAIMALVVVLNLIAMYINEKSKTLAVMRINGFTLRETKSFMSFSNVILTILGLIVGVAVGILVSIQIINIIESDSVAYSHAPNITACLISCVISIGYAAIIGVIGNRRINKLELNNLNRYE